MRHKARQVPTRARKASRVPFDHRVRDVQKDNRNVRRRRFGRSNRLGLERHDEVDALTDEVPRRLAGRLLIGQIPPVQPKVASLFVSQRFQRFPQGFKGRRNVVQAHVEEAEAPDSPPSLGRRAQWREKHEHDDPQHDRLSCGPSQKADHPGHLILPPPQTDVAVGPPSRAGSTTKRRSPSVRLGQIAGGDRLRWRCARPVFNWDPITPPLVSRCRQRVR